MKNVKIIIDMNSIMENLSESRISSYSKTGENLNIAVARHQWNVRIGESMKPVLTYYELLLRNRIDKLFTGKYSSDWLINIPEELKMSSETLQKIKTAKQKFYEDKKIAAGHNDILAMMSLGFWTSFFHRRYDVILWQKDNNIGKIFPFLPRRFRTRKLIEPKIRAIKEVRNRIAHLEPIWNMNPPIADVHKYCIELIGYMSKDVLALVREIDRFDEVMQDKI